MFLRFLFNIANLLGNLLQRILVVCVLCLEVCQMCAMSELSSGISGLRNLPCCLFAEAAGAEAVEADIAELLSE
jgi:hypothetical protein